MKQLASFGGLSSTDAALPDLDVTFDAIASLLKLYNNSHKQRSRMTDRLAKAESNYEISITKIEKLTDELQAKDKKIGEIENSMHRELAIAKERGRKGRTEEIAKEKSRVAKGATEKHFEAEIKKKDIEIAKLKDALKRSALTQRDKSDAESKWSKFEVNSFYNGLENDFNMLDTKKSEIYRGHAEESSDLRHIVMDLYNELRDAVKEVVPGSTFNSTLTWSLLNKPMTFAKDNVMACCRDLILQLRASKIGYSANESAWQKDKVQDLYRLSDIPSKVDVSDKAPTSKWHVDSKNRQHYRNPSARLLNESERFPYSPSEKPKHFYRRSDIHSALVVTDIDDSPADSNDGGKSIRRLRDKF